MEEKPTEWNFWENSCISDLKKSTGCEVGILIMKMRVPDQGWQSRGTQERGTWPPLRVCCSRSPLRTLVG